MLDALGRVVVAGASYVLNGNVTFTVARYGTDGLLDASFGNGGIVTFPTSSTGFYSAGLEGVAMQADGRIVVVGAPGTVTTAPWTLFRLTATGLLDPGFGHSGMVTTAFPGQIPAPGAVRIQPDGRIVVVGVVDDQLSGYGSAFGVVRYLANGAPDTSFGTNGVVLTSFGPNSYGGATALVFQPGGKIVVAGHAMPGARFEFTLVRYLTDGTVDTTFGVGGVQSVGSPTLNLLSPALAEQADGKLVVAGTKFTVARLDADGALDPSFGTGGVIAGGTGPDARDVGIQADGKIVAAGGLPEGGLSIAVVRRYDSAGVPDPSFGTAGEVTTLSGASLGYDYWNATLIQADGRVVAIGNASNGGFGLARFLGDSASSCGNNVLEPGETCDDGNVTTGDGCSDTCHIERCTDMITPKLRLARFDTPSGDDVLSFSGKALLPSPFVPSLDPASNGFRVRVGDPADVAVLDVTVPGGSGWSVNATGSSWKFKSAVPIAGMVTKANITTKSSAPGLVKFTVSGKKGALAAASPALPVHVEIFLDLVTSSTNECATASFLPVSASRLPCRFKVSGGMLTCH